MSGKKDKKDKGEDKDGGEKEHKEKKDKKETFNSLDEKYQLQPGMDDDHIFPGELELIAQLRKVRPELEKESDKFLCVFLFARRHNFEDTLELLDKFCKKRKELGLDENSPLVSKDEALRKHCEQGAIMKPKRAVDKSGRLLHYVFVAKDKPKDRPISLLYTYSIWEALYQIQTETLRTWRDGSCLVVDFKGFGLSNIDLSPKGIEFSKALSGLFPKRIRKVYLVNGGWLLKIISEGAKLVLSKKLCERVEIITQDNLKTVIPEEWLLTDYGGKFACTAQDWVDEARRDEEKWEREKKHSGEASSASKA